MSPCNVHCSLKILTGNFTGVLTVLTAYFDHPASSCQFQILNEKIESKNKRNLEITSQTVQKVLSSVTKKNLAERYIRYFTLVKCKVRPKTASYFISCTCQTTYCSGEDGLSEAIRKEDQKKFGFKKVLPEIACMGVMRSELVYRSTKVSFYNQKRNH